MPPEDRTVARWTPISGEDALVAQYRPLALAISNDYFIPGADRDDVKQEALIGLLVAARDFNGEGQFGSFAWLVIHRWLQTCVNTARRQKQMPLNEATGDATLSFMSGGIDPAEALEQAEELRRVQRGYATLTESEREGLRIVTNGDSYAQRADRKRIDNAIQRARRKLKAAA